MNDSVVTFKVTKLTAQVNEPVTLEWQGKEFDAGPITVELDPSDSNSANQGALDYSLRHARAEFHVRLTFPEFAGTLEALGLGQEFTGPIRAVIRSEGAILDDHSFALSGDCNMGPHTLFPPEETRAAVLPGI
ncbi:MAG TPA: hypothetical protein VNW97_19080 [Candidatus Saccharimonadales bacterium]|jgi:hypothetical protein|nr:hypothetical protein [Candidatus Saccharimonadales bacterium]